MIILACDHAGYQLKEDIKEFFNKENITTIDVGTILEKVVIIQILQKLEIKKFWKTQTI